MKNLVILRQPRSNLLIGVVGGIFAAFCLWLSINEEAWVFLINLGFTLLSVYLITSYLLERHELSEKGLVCRTIFGMNKAVQWSDIQSVRYCPYPKAWFRLNAGSGTVVRVSFQLEGIHDFAGLVVEKAPKRSFDKTADVILRAVATGFPPPLRLN